MGRALGVVTQFFLNMEVERYTLATGETAVTGFNRFWKHWGLVFAVLGYFGNLWPGWAISSATLASYLFGGNPTVIAVVSLLVIGFSLTLAPVVYVALERLIFVKVAAVLILVVLGIAFAIDPRPGARCPADSPASARSSGLELGIGLWRHRICRRGWRAESLSKQLDPRQGIWHGAVRAEAGEPGDRRAAGEGHDGHQLYLRADTREHGSAGEAGGGSPTSSRCSASCWSRFSRSCLTSLLAYSTLFGQPSLPNDVSFLRLEAQQLQRTVASWFGILFLAVGAFSLFGSAMGIIDYTSRLAADILKTTYRPGASESRMYFWLVWGMVGLGCTILLTGISQPLTLLVISASTAGTMMFSLFIHADRAESKDAAAGHSYRPIQNRHARVVHVDVWLACRADHLYADPDAASLTRT